MEFILGNRELLADMARFAAEKPFSKEIVGLCDAVSKELMHDKSGRKYPDVVTLGFWLRKASVLALRERFVGNVAEGSYLQFGRGLIFHVAPSNVPVNFAYSLFAGLLCGNANVVRVPSKDFPQVKIIVEVLDRVIKNGWEQFTKRICLVRYGHEQSANDYLSSLCDVRVIWGGDNTIAEIRKSPLPARSTEVTFADRFSLAVIDVALYASMTDEEKTAIARGFYNDTYLTDQNACTSPRLVVWKLGDNAACEGSGTEKTIEEFWRRLWEIVEREYVYQDIQGVNKLTNFYKLASECDVTGKKFAFAMDNRLFRVRINEKLDECCERKNLKEFFDNAGYFLEYVTDDLTELKALCGDKHCQTIGYVGDINMLMPLLNSGIKGVDRAVPIGRTMDFDLLWDGYDLMERFTRKIIIG